MIGHNIVYGYADADFASDVDSRKSTTGWIFMFNGGAISWRSHQQSITALSTSEAEYMSLSDAATTPSRDLTRRLMQYTSTCVNLRITG